MKNDRKELEERLLAKAMKDDEFRKQLLLDPKGAVEKELGIDLPGSMKIYVLEEKGDEIYLVLPAFHSPGTELSETELESVAGGWSAFTGECGSCGYCPL